MDLWAELFIHVSKVLPGEGDPESGAMFSPYLLQL
ncbi:MAG: hypothetical protein AVDCRST_MAG22-170 [uncultured Rubrobacteraceae bacterium]|uniref:Uncharacterized protein n=1 Tax=uncultured Rubrobacteraceae bacterium TaxID=349277 RepID=A0A6J4NCZ9_9ACTN|nr:MAG: hypothetical protein AVDCRST_MAG22-170 [uncultured Rubrobacteraceae bacterium]